jgi:hypothetical protein
MPRRLIVVEGLLVALVLPVAAWGGVYTPGAPTSQKALEPPYRQIGKPAPPDGVLRWVDDLRQVAMAQAPPKAEPAGRPLRAEYLSFAQGLEDRLRNPGLTTSECISLGGCFVRLGRWPQALRILEDGLRRERGSDPARFLLLLNLAAAYGNDRDLLPRAIETQRQALSAWPAEWSQWSHEEWAWYRRAENYQLVLMEQRHREALQGPQPSPTPAPLFLRVRWVGPSGRFEAGTLAVQQWDKLPPDAEQLVVQLMLWEPQDTRLLWLYGELLNARGQVPAAFKVLDQYVLGRGLSSPDLHSHRAVLRQAKGTYERRAKAAEEQQLAADTPTDSGAPRPAEPPRAPAPVLPEWRAVLVSFAAGCVCTLLGVFQWHQWRRKRHAPSQGSVAHAPAEP